MSYLKTPSTSDKSLQVEKKNKMASAAPTPQHPLSQKLAACRASNMAVQHFLKAEAIGRGQPEPQSEAYSVPRTYHCKTGVWSDQMLDNVLERILFHDTGFAKGYLEDGALGWAGRDSLLVAIGEEGPDGKFGYKEIQVATTSEKYAKVDAAIRKMVLWEMMQERLSVHGFCEFTVGGSGSNYGPKRTEARDGPTIRTAFLFTEWSV